MMSSQTARMTAHARRARREGLRVLQLSGNSQLAAPGLAALRRSLRRALEVAGRFLSPAQPASLFLRTRKKPGPFPALSF